MTGAQLRRLVDAAQLHNMQQLLREIDVNHDGTLRQRTTVMQACNVQRLARDRGRGEVASQRIPMQRLSTQCVP